MAQRPIRVLIADDDDFERDGLKTYFEIDDDIEVIGETDDALAARRLTLELSPDVVIIDLRWNQDESLGWVTIQEIKDRLPNIKIIALTAYAHLIERARKAGADLGFVKGSVRASHLLNAIKELAARDDPVTAPVLIEKKDMLTPREITVLDLLVDGLSHQDIAETLHISVHTVNNHCRNICGKLGVDTTRKATKKARDLGWVD